MSREYPSYPIAGVAAIVFQDRKVLLVLRKNEPSQGKWGLPGGVIEIGETSKEAIKREVKEETGLLVRVVKLLDIYDSIVKDDEGKIRFNYVLCEYLCEVTGGTLTPSSDVSDARWIDLHQLEALDMNPYTRKFIKKTATKENI